MKTPVGLMPAELVTFHADGSLDSVFPLNGQIGFGWSLEDEEQLAQPYAFEFSFAKVIAKITGIRFLSRWRNKKPHSVAEGSCACAHQSGHFSGPYRI